MGEWSDLLSMDFEAGMERQLHMTLGQALYKNADGRALQAICS